MTIENQNQWHLKTNVFFFFLKNIKKNWFFFYDQNDKKKKTFSSVMCSVTWSSPANFQKTIASLIAVFRDVWATDWLNRTASLKTMWPLWPVSIRENTLRNLVQSFLEHSNSLLLFFFSFETKIKKKLSKTKKQKKINFLKKKKMIKTFWRVNFLIRH